MTYRVSALYVDPRGPYPGLVADWWDETRDARNYAGPLPVVAHPPCGAYGNLRHMRVPNRERRDQDASCGPIAFEQVRRWGGVLEQPRGSTLFALCEAPMPGELPDKFGGVTIEVEQVRFGHPARKRTWLYLMGVRDAGSDPPPREPTHWVCGGRNPMRKNGRSGGGVVPPGIKVCSAQQRRRTPIAFAHFLCQLAESARQPPTNIPQPQADLRDPRQLAATEITSGSAKTESLRFEDTAFHVGDRGSNPRGDANG